MKKGVIYTILISILALGVLFSGLLVAPRAQGYSLGCSEYGSFAYEDFDGYCKCMSDPLEGESEAVTSSVEWHRLWQS